MRSLLVRAAAVVALCTAGCGDDCGSIGRFTDENGLTVLVVCGQIQTPLPTRTPTPTPK